MSNVIHCGKYDVNVGDDVFLQLGKFPGLTFPSSRKIIITDENTSQHCLPLLLEHMPALKDADVIEMKAGEANKNLAACEKIWEQLTSLHCDRHSVIVNLGGGVVCDVGGFAASVFLRGVDFINLPTSLLSMVDSSVGGKTGINFAGLKNQVGTFTRPRAVFVSPLWLRTLQKREIKSGFAEMIKHALISSREKWETLSAITSLDDIDWMPAVYESIFLKNRIVNADFRDRHIRKTLNFGHTVGHALESYSVEHNADPLKHGEAIALGMMAEVFLSEKLVGFPADDAVKIQAFLSRHYGHAHNNFDSKTVLERMKSDKKNEHGRIHVVLLESIGKPVVREVDEPMILNALLFLEQKTGKETFSI